MLKRTILISFLISYLFAQSNKTIPTTHWIYDSIRKLQVEGYLTSLDQGSVPYKEKDIYNSLFGIEQPSELPRQLYFEYQRLTDYFTLPNLNKSQNDNSLLIGINPSIDLGTKYQDKSESISKIRLNGSLDIHQNFIVNYSGYLDNRFKNEETYDGYEWRGMAGVQGQMYMAFISKSLTLKFGRDYVKWGYGHTGNLLISDNSRPFDMINMNVDSKYLSLQTFTTQLDQMYNAERYLTAIRFETKIKNKLYIGLGQSAIYGGENRPVDFTISNPLAFYSFTQDNDHKAMNMMLYMDFAYRFLQGKRVYCEILIDDFQIDHAVKSDLEPNEIGLLFGIDVNDIILGYSSWLEFIQVRNRTYNVPNQRPFEKYLHKNQYIAHPMGTDFQMFQINFDKWTNRHFKHEIGYQLIRKGEGTIRGEFTEPYLEDDITLDTGYHEKIPYGIVETTNNIYFNFHYELSASLQCELMMTYSMINNVNHIESYNRDDFSFTFVLMGDFNFRKLIRD